MSEKIIRSMAFVSSALLLVASAGVIIWIARDEESRLAARERAAIEAAEKAAAEERVFAASEGAEESKNSENLLRDIDILLDDLSSDDLPEED